MDMEGNWPRQWLELSTQVFLCLCPEKLGGFKVLKDVTLISLFSPKQSKGFPSRFFSFIADEKINLPYVTCVSDDHVWGLNIAVESRDAGKVSA